MKKTTDPIRRRLKSHYTNSGGIFELSEADCLGRFKDLVGDHRFNRMERLRRKHKTTDVYRSLKTLDEWNALFNLQIAVTFETSLWLDACIRNVARPNQVILDLGCGSGIFTRWLAGQHRSCHVTGVDALPNLVKIARQSSTAKNLDFKRWDYTGPMPNGIPAANHLICSLGIDFAIEQDSIPIDHQPLRSGAAYAKRKLEIQTILQNWRQAAADDANLFVVLRIPDATRFLAAVDAAAEAGWQWQHQRLTFVQVGAESFPALTFVAAQPQAAPYSEHELLLHWDKRNFAARFGSPITGELARLLYSALANREMHVDEKRTDFMQGLVHTSIGTSGAFAFHYHHTTNGRAQLRLAPASELGDIIAQYQEDADAEHTEFMWLQTGGFAEY